MKIKRSIALLTLAIILKVGVLTLHAQMVVNDPQANATLQMISGKVDTTNEKLNQIGKNTGETLDIQKRAEKAAEAAGEMRKNLNKLAELQEVANAISDPSKTQAALGGIKIDPQTGKPTGAAYGFIEDMFSPSGQPIGALALAMPPFIAAVTDQEAQELLKFAKERAALAEGKRDIEVTAAAISNRLRVTSTDPKDIEKLAKGLRQVLSGQAGGGDYGVLAPNVVIRPYAPETDDLYYDTFFKKSAGIGRAVFYTEAGKKKYEVYLGDLGKLGSVLGDKIEPSINLNNSLSKGYKQAYDDFLKNYEKQNKGAKNPYKDYADKIVPGLAVMHANGELAGASTLTNDQIRRAMELTAKSGQLSSTNVPSLFDVTGVTELDKKAAEAKAALEKASGTSGKTEDEFGSQTTDLNQASGKKYVVVVGLDPVREEGPARQALSGKIQELQKLQAEYAITKASIAYNQGVLTSIHKLSGALGKIQVSDQAATGGAGADLAAIRIQAINQAKGVQKVLDGLQRREKVLDRERTGMLGSLEKQAELVTRQTAQKGPLLVQAIKDRAHTRKVQEKQIELDKQSAQQIQNDPYGLNRDQQSQPSQP